MTSISEERAAFNATDAPKLAAKAGHGGLLPMLGRSSKRFVHYADDQRVVIVAGAQEGVHVDLALAHGLAHVADGRKLVLLLPVGFETPTIQRAPWLRADARPEVWVHRDGDVEQLEPLSQDETLDVVRRWIHPATPAEELAAAMKPLYLGDRADGVDELVEWATRHPQLDHAHRRSERSWHCMGQRVLSISTRQSGLVIRSGIHTVIAGDDDPSVVKITDRQLITPEQLADIQHRVESGIDTRLHDIRTPYCKADEHWLQAIIRRQPSLVGVEQPALRELPAWRPKAGSSQKTRGYLDLVGLDGHGDIRLVETKLAANSDDLLVFQGIDYYVWASAYHEPICQRLGANPNAQIVVHYVIGATPKDAVHISPYARRHAQLLDSSVPFRFQLVRGWFVEPGGPVPTAKLFAAGELPAEKHAS